MQAIITGLQATMGDLWYFCPTPTPPEGVEFDEWWEMWYSKVEDAFLKVAQQTQSPEWLSTELTRLKELAEGTSEVAEAARSKMSFMQVMSNPKVWPY